jgi:hypothetical protein
MSNFALRTAVALGVLVSARAAFAQRPAEQPKSWELLVTSGALVPTGDQANSIKNAGTTAAQVSWMIRPSLGITGTFAWSRSRDVSMVSQPKLDVFSSDLGVEKRLGQRFRENAVTFRPFVGLGGGARSYNYRKLDEDATHNAAVYGAIGGEIGVRRVGVRIEARDYVSQFKPLVGAGQTATRNDVVVMVGLRFKRQHASDN